MRDDKILQLLINLNGGTLIGKYFPFVPKSGKKGHRHR